MVFAICCLAGMVGDRPIKTLLGALIGLFLATVGIDAGSGVYRYTFDDVHLSDGIQFIVVVIGLFSISEMLVMLEQSHAGQVVIKNTGRAMFNLKEMAETWWGTVRSSLIGFVIGVLPGAGASIASAITYMVEKNLTDREGTFGTGDIRGVAAPEAANNSAAGGAFVPMLTLGVPGSGTTAVMVGALTLYNITPGPLLFEQQPDLVWGLIASMFIGNVMLLVMNIPMVGLFSRLLHVPNWILVPGIAAISFVGRVRGARDHVRPRPDGGPGHLRLAAAQAGLPDGAAHPGVRAGRHDGAEPAPRARRSRTATWGSWSRARCPSSCGSSRRWCSWRPG